MDFGGRGRGGHEGMGVLRGANGVGGVEWEVGEWGRGRGMGRGGAGDKRGINNIKWGR